MAIDTPSSAHIRMQKKRKLPKTLYEGTQAMRDAGVTYLPMEAGELQAMYDARLNRSFLKNYFKSAVQGTRAKIFSSPIQVTDYPDEDIIENVDMQGTDLTTFASDLYTEGCKDGMSFILIDSPTMEESASQADVIANNVRPFFTVIKAEQILGHKIVMVKNIPTLSEVRIKESYTETDQDFEEQQYDQIRHMQLVVMGDNEDDDMPDEFLGVMVTIYRKLTDDDEYEVFTSVTIDIPRIPLAVYYTNQTGTYEAEPFFEDLAWLNLQHWQSSSDQNNILHFVRVPRFYGFGFKAEELEKIEKHGVASFLYSTKSPTDVKAGWIEAKGDSIKQGQESINDLEETMEAQSLEPLVSKATADITATKTKTDAAKSNSMIQFWARNLSSALYDAFLIV